VCPRPLQAKVYALSSKQALNRKNISVGFSDRHLHVRTVPAVFHNLSVSIRIIEDDELLSRQSNELQVFFGIKHGLMGEKEYIEQRLDDQIDWYDSKSQ